ncbi:5677_t:CDS:1, partial [Racocetra persica]
SNSKEWVYPSIESKIFQPKQKLAATFSKPTPITELRDLATSTEKSFASLNNVSSNVARATYYFYQYLKKNLHTVAENDGIQELSKEKALEKIINSTTDVHTLARIITFYEIQSQFKISLKQTRIDYDKFYYPEAENFLIKYLNISIPTQYNDTFYANFKLT